MTDYEKICDLNILYEAFKKSKRGSYWKESVQKYELNLLSNLRELQLELINKTYKPQPFYEFQLAERGKTRWIKANTIKDRIVRHALCDEILNPILDKYLIYDNGASRKGKGIDFTRNRLDKHLHKYYQENKSNDGYILLIDYSKYYDNINHLILNDMISNKIKDKDVLNLFQKIIKTFQVDVSYMTDEEFKQCYDTKFDLLQYQLIDKEKLTGTKFMKKSVGIGDQTSQISGIFYLTPIDNYCKIVKGEKYYGRYMDDLYVIHKDKEHLKQLQKEIEVESRKVGMFLNNNKTRITKISNTFTFLKLRYRLTDTGKVIKKIAQQNVTRERRKIKLFKQKLINKEMSYGDIRNQYLSWLGNSKKYLSKKTLNNFIQLYNDLYSKEEEKFLHKKEQEKKFRKKYKYFRKKCLYIKK